MMRTTDLSSPPVSAATKQTPLLTLNNLTRLFDSTRAVNDFNLVVDQGEYITLLGPSGCGKTTTLRMIGGFIMPSEGQILLDGIDIAGLPPEKRPLNTVFQDYALFPHLTVWQNVEYGLRVRRVTSSERRQRVEEMLNLVQIRALAERYPRYLSGGQQQRVALARALVCRPRLLLLDEPLGALDAQLREQMQIVLKDLQRSLNIAFIHVTHDQVEAMALADRIVVMRAGAMEQCGTPDDLYHRPANSFVAEFLGTTNLFEGRCVRMDDSTVTLDVKGVPLQGVSASRFASGDSVFLSVRPSAIHVSQSGRTGAPNEFEGVVEGLVYRGEGWLIRVQVGEFHLRAMIPIGVGASLVVGDRVTVSWSADDCWLMSQ